MSITDRLLYQLSYGGLIKDLLDTNPLTLMCADVHLRFFHDLLAVLETDAHPAA